MKKLRRVGVVLFWTFVILAMAGQIAGAEELNNVPYLPSPGDGGFGPGEIAWWHAVGAVIALVMIWFC